MNDDTGRPVKPHRSGGGLRQTPAEIPLPNYTRDRCAVRGLVRPGGMCASVIVGGEFCGYGGECEHKVPNDRVEGRDACGASLSHAGLAGD